MNWAKKLLRSEKSECSVPVCDRPDERIICDVCGKILDSESPTCPVCGVALCDDEECRNEHIAEHHPEWDGDDRPRCDYCGRGIDPDANWMLDTRNGTEHFCCAECQHERAAEIEAAPLCAWCHEKCDRGVVHPPDSSVPFCSTECLEKFRASSATGRCGDCERDGDCGHCPGHPGYTKPNPF